MHKSLDEFEIWPDSTTYSTAIVDFLSVSLRGVRGCGVVYVTATEASVSSTPTASISLFYAVYHRVSRGTPRIFLPRSQLVIKYLRAFGTTNRRRVSSCSPWHIANFIAQLNYLYF